MPQADGGSGRACQPPHRPLHSPPRRPARSPHFPLSPRSAGGDAAGRGGLRARPHQIAEAPHRHFVTPPPAGKVGAVGLTRRSPGGRCRNLPLRMQGVAGRGRRHIPDIPEPCYDRLRTGVPLMRITRNRADAFVRPAGSSPPRSPRLNLTEPRQTNLIAPTPPDQIETTPETRPRTKNPPKTDHRRPRSPAPPAGELPNSSLLLGRQGAGGPRTHAALPAARQSANICAGV